MKITLYIDDWHFTAPVGSQLAKQNMVAPSEVIEEARKPIDMPAEDPPRIGGDGKPWPQTTDAKTWAQEFGNTLKKHPQIAECEDTMHGWFANAIMIGMDTQWRSMEKERDALKQERDALKQERDALKQELADTVDNWNKDAMEQKRAFDATEDVVRRIVREELATSERSLHRQKYRTLGVGEEIHETDQYRGIYGNWVDTGNEGTLVMDYAAGKYRRPI